MFSACGGSRHLHPFDRASAEIPAYAAVRADALARSRSVLGEYWARLGMNPGARFGKTAPAHFAKRLTVDRFQKELAALSERRHPNFVNSRSVAATVRSAGLAALPLQCRQNSSFRCCTGSSFRPNSCDRHRHHDRHKHRWSCWRSCHSRRENRRRLGQRMSGIRIECLPPC